ncbi:MAG: aspartate/glutamate racemase family protein [Candidatus Natronoplasma sp.]
MKIKIVEPVTTESFLEETKKEVKKHISEDFKVDVEAIKYGTGSIESSYDESLCAPNIIKIVEESNNDDYDGVYINCFGDPGFEGAREVADIPVVSPGHASIFIASEIAQKFTILTPVKSSLPRDEEKVRKEGLLDNLASIRSIDLPVLELEDKEKMTEALIDESKKAVVEDDAHAIVLGCTGMMGITDDLESALHDLGHYIPVVHPLPTSLKYLKMLIELNIKQSEMTYMTPKDKERNLFERLE